MVKKLTLVSCNTINVRVYYGPQPQKRTLMAMISRENTKHDVSNNLVVGRIFFFFYEITGCFGHSVRGQVSLRV